MLALRRGIGVGTLPVFSVVFRAQATSSVGSGPAGGRAEVVQADTLLTFCGLGEAFNDLMTSVHRESLFHHFSTPLRSLERQSFREQK